ncbi:alkaline phosphatase [Verrucomicrobium sp. BvORR106]|uniref:alkaline phosphatase family protein n=1 Tax=Verrucomicrobium sp. BvORR106 TaxID=1403819 RepID=UPI0009DD9F92|nr:alkaline phosphatase [Verrucomicrobium sp. BvORR106]
MERLRWREMDTDTQQPTISGPGWASIFTGVWIDRHQVDGNATPPVNQANVRGSYMVDQAPHFARRLKSAVPAASVASFAAWDWIETYLVDAQPEAFDAHDRGVGIKYPDRDLNTQSKTLGYLETKSPDVLIVHFDQVDGAGHATGFGTDNPIYMEAIQKVDSHVGEVLSAVRHRPGAEKEKWLVLVTTDHGGTGRKHGGQSLEERTIPLIANGPGVPESQVINTPFGHTIIAPTIFRYLNVPVDASWGWNAAVFALGEAVVAR